MGWLRKKFRQLDKRVRKIFGKNAWVKVATLIGATYVGMGSFGGKPTAGLPWFSTGTTSGKLATIGSNLWNGIKKIFWTPKTTTTTSSGTIVGVPGSPTWAGRVAGSVAGTVIGGAIMKEAFPEEMRGQMAAFAPQEGRGIGDLGVTAAGSGTEVASLMDAYRNFNFGTDSPMPYMNMLGPKRTPLPLQNQLTNQTSNIG